MKLLLVWHAGGVTAYWKRIEELAKKFDEVVMLVPKTWNEGGKEVFTTDQQLLPNCRIITADTLFNMHAAAHVYRNGLTKLLKEFRPDIIHIHEEPWSLSTFQVMMLNKWLGVNAKIVIDSAAITVWNKPLFSWIEKWVYGRTDLFFARNQEVQDILRQRGCTSPTYILPNGVDTEMFRELDAAEVEAWRNKLNLPADRSIIAYLGRMIPEKGIYDFIEAAEQLLAKNEHPYTFLLVGSGPEKEKIKQRLKDKNIEQYFVQVDKVDSHQVPAVMNVLDLLVLPSRTAPNWKEQFGRVLVEAMSCGKPVVGSSSGAIPEVIDDPRFVFPEGDSQALADTIHRVFTDTEMLESALRNSRERAHHRYSWEALADYYMQVLREVGISSGTARGLRS